VPSQLQQSPQLQFLLLEAQLQVVQLQFWQLHVGLPQFLLAVGAIGLVVFSIVFNLVI